METRRDTGQAQSGPHTSPGLLWPSFDVAVRAVLGDMGACCHQKLEPQQQSLSRQEHTQVAYVRGSPQQQSLSRHAHTQPMARGSPNNSPSAYRHTLSLWHEGAPTTVPQQTGTHSAYGTREPQQQSLSRQAHTQPMARGSPNNSPSADRHTLSLWHEGAPTTVPQQTGTHSAYGTREPQQQSLSRQAHTQVAYVRGWLRLSYCHLGSLECV